MPGKPATGLRLNVYVDGYNFYVPLRTMDERQYELCWCDFLALGQMLTERLAAERPSEFAIVDWARCSISPPPFRTICPRTAVASSASALDSMECTTSKGKVEVVHGTFRASKHRFYIERDELDNLVRGGIPVDRNRLAPEGAMHELFVEATCLRAGFSIVHENQKDPNGKHVEFMAVHKATSQHILVEAKSRHRAGVMAQPGSKEDLPDIRFQRLINSAIAKDPKNPLANIR